MHLNQGPFDRIKKGIQKYETRLYDEKRKLLKVGDYIIFDKLGEQNNTYKTKVLELHVFDNFKEMFEKLDKKELGYPEHYTIDMQIKAMEKYYSKKQQKQYSVLAIKLEVVK